MTRVLLVDDSASVRKLFGEKLRAAGFDVEEVADGTKGAERALSSPPDVVVTDLWMPVISGVQLCRLLRAEPATAHVPVVLLSATDNRKARFWARTAGAAAYVTKSEVENLVPVLTQVIAAANTTYPAHASARLSGSIQERMSQLLDAALYESVVTSKVRSLLGDDGDPQRLFAALVDLASDVMSYVWLSLEIGPENPLFLHTHPSVRASSEADARKALRVESADIEVDVLEDERANGGEGGPVLVTKVSLGQHPLGQIALALGPRGASRDDERFMQLVAQELPGPLQVLALIQATKRIAQTDSLTGLMNRRAFIDAMGREHSRSERHGHSITLLMLDVDFFKKVNDTRGHAAGDAILKGVAGVLTKFARKSDFVARWGGEEFIVALAQTSDVGGRVAAERLRRSLADTEHAMPEGEPLTVTASIGIATAKPRWVLDELIGRADDALYLAKSRGRNRVEVG